MKKEVNIRKLRLSDAKELQKCINNEEVIKTLTGIKYPFTLEASKKYIGKSIKDKDTHEFVMICGGNVVGSIVLENPNKNKDVFEVGYVVTKTQWGKGIATKAVKQIVKYGFNKLKLKKI